MYKISAIVLIIALITACRKDPAKVKRVTPCFPDNAVNLSFLNSEYDDYNSDLIVHGQQIVFSSNRNSQGGQYDLIVKTVGYIGDDIEGDVSALHKDTHYTSELIDSSNSEYNEFGPYSLGFKDYSTIYSSISMLMFSSDISGNQDIYITYSGTINNNYSEKEYFGPLKLKIIDSSANELYPTFHGDNLFFHDPWVDGNYDIHNMLYCSDKDGCFDIYSIDFTYGREMLTNLLSTEVIEPTKLDISSSSDDKCPYVNGDFMVFTSNRPGGYGGFDLYYSHYVDGQWSEPINFGEGVNSEYDEYRPVSLYTGKQFGNDVMVFSSNRTGGKGGFDLYYVGIDRFIED